MKAEGLVFVSARPVQLEPYGECRMEVWRVREAEENKLREPRYLVQYYQRGFLVDESY